MGSVDAVAVLAIAEDVLSLVEDFVWGPTGAAEEDILRIPPLEFGTLALLSGEETSQIVVTECVATIATEWDTWQRIAGVLSDKLSVAVEEDYQDGLKTG